MLYQLSYSRPENSTTARPKIRPRRRPCKDDDGAALQAGLLIFNLLPLRRLSGEERIRTSVGLRRQIYSLLPLASSGTSPSP